MEVTLDIFGKEAEQRKAAVIHDGEIVGDMRWNDRAGRWDPVEASPPSMNGSMAHAEPAATTERSRRATAEVRVRRLTSIEPKPVDWLWPGWIPAGTVTVLDGDPGLGKSTLLLDLAARVSRGLSMPDGSRGGAPAGVVILSAEDDPARVIRPRLELAGADLERVALVSILTGDGAEREPTIDAPDLKRVEAAVREVSARLLVVDPL